MEKKTVVSIIVVFIVIFVLGFVILIQQEGKLSLVSPQGTETSMTPSARETSPVSGNTNILRRFPDNASQEERDQYIVAVAAAAQKTGKIEIQNGCKITPPVLYVKDGQDFSAHNASNKDYMLTLGPGYDYSIPAGKTISIKVNIGKINASGYGCVEDPAPTGFVSALLYIVK